MYDELIKDLRETDFSDCCPCGAGPMCKDKDCVILQASDAIEELSAKVESLQFFADNISKLPDCNTCFKKNMCEFKPKLGEYCRINCPAWLGKPPKEET